ncbi:hypothetical protein OHC33_000560 [Knufia fluminis]|uniref:Uncharacterized protein n=2 Tax=Knufia TaxID=430999 RepID=A0AAN8IT08_9EURO|nr:hypothetical protein OHC33_000560 [Knufia fluminis]
MKKAMPGIDMWNRDVNSMSAMRREKPETVVDNSNASGQEHNAGVEQTAYVLGIGEIGTEPSVDVGITSIDEVTTEAGSQFDGPEWGLYPQRL